MKLNCCLLLAVGLSLCIYCSADNADQVNSTRNLESSGNNNEERIDLEAIIIPNKNRRQSIKRIITSLIGSNLNVTNEENEESTEEENSSAYYERSGSGSFQYENEANVSDIQIVPNNTEQVPSNHDLIVTAEGVDPHDPEEIARKEYYKTHLDTFQQIMAINQHFANSATFIREGDVKLDPTRNAGGGAVWSKSRVGRYKGLVRIPYKISSQYNSTHISVIRSAMASYAKHSCIRFVARRTETAYLFINDGRGCWAYVGKTGYAAQSVSLGIPGCVTKGIALHELMHAVGFQHEHSRNDRDKFVRILNDNIDGGMNANFDKHDYTKNLVIYDYGSVMHYSRHAFAKQPYLPSIEIYPKRKLEPSIGQRTRLSPYDIEEIKYLYNCDENSYERCGKDFIHKAGGTFQSPSFPSSYPKESHCTWNMTARAGRYIKITFNNVDIIDSPICQSDAVLVHDGRNAAAPVLKKVCGIHSSSIEVTSTGRHLFVIFSSDITQNPHTGFRATFREVSRPGKKAQLLTVPVLPPITSTINQFQCNFDHDLCSMTQDSLDDLDYIHGRGSTPSRGTGPTADHTTGIGHYLYIESSLPAKVGNRAIIRTPWFSRSRLFCVSYNYHMHGSYMGGLRVYAFEKRRNDNYGHEILLWEKYGNQGSRWIEKKISYKPRRNVENVQFYWESYVYFYQSDIALDDIKVTFGSCKGDRTVPSQSKTVVQTTQSRSTTPRSPTTTASTTSTAAPVRIYSSIDCTFDHGLCGFSQPTSDNFDWTRNSGDTPSSSTGPSGDHTSGSGHYMYVEASSPRRLGHTARLISPILTSTRHCLRMWYHMYGKQTGTLSVWEVNNGKSRLLIEKVGDNGNHWLPLAVEVNSPNFKKTVTRRDPRDRQLERPLIDPVEDDLEPEIILDEVLQANISYDAPSNAVVSSTNLQIYIEGTIGRGYAGDIAIDDLRITDSPCEQEVTTPSTNVIKEEFSCDFESGNNLCGLTQVANDDFDWLPNSGNTGSSGTGPSTDFTTKTDSGVYIYTESSSPRRVHDVAELMTPQLKPRQYCVRFAYHMHGSATGDLKLLSMEETNDDTTATPIRLWGESGPQGNQWYSASASFSPSGNSKAVQFIFQGRIGTSFTSDMALDDISITLGQCTTGSTTASTTSMTPPPTTTTTTTTIPPTTTTTTTTTTTPPTTTTTTTTTPPTTTTTTTSPSTTTMTTTTTTTTPAPTTTTTTPPPTTTTTTLPPPKTTTTTPPTTTTTTTTTTPPTTTSLPITTTTTTSSPKTTTVLPRVINTQRYPSGFSCNFERSNLCGMSQITDDVFDWTRNKGRTASRNTGPNRDHTASMGGEGHYIYIESSNPRRQGDVAVITTPKLSVTTPKRCLLFWYNMNGRGMGSLQIYADFTPASKVSKSARVVTSSNRKLQTEQGGKGAQWKLLQVEIDQDPEFYGGSMNISFHGIRGASFLSDLAIDDICVAEGPCDTSSRCSANGILAPPTQPLTTSPRSRRPKGAKVKLATTPETTRSTITKAPTTTTTNTTPAFTTTTLPPTTTTATTTTAPTTAAGPPSWPGMPLCTFEINRRRSSRRAARTPAMPDNAPDDLGEVLYPNSIVNSDMCGWRQTRQDQFDWDHHRGSTRSQNTGPNGDKTTGRGYYMYIEASSPRKTNDAAFLQTYLMPSTEYCLNVNYNMYGSRMGRLRVRAIQKLSNDQEVLTHLYSVTGNQGNQWKFMQINYTPRADAVNVEFRLEGYVGRDYRSDMAVDDIGVLPGRCDVCKKPTKHFVNDLNQRQNFTTGCVNSSLFWVRCCSITNPKAVFRRVTQCNANMFTPERLNWYCSYL